MKPVDATTLCDKLGVRRQVAFIVSSCLVGCEKPDPRIFYAALEQAGIAAAINGRSAESAERRRAERSRTGRRRHTVTVELKHPMKPQATPDEAAGRDTLARAKAMGAVR